MLERDPMTTENPAGPTGHLHFVGIDVGSEKLDLDSGSLDLPKVIGNDIEAFKAQLAPRLKDFDRTLFVAEASGGYERKLVDFLQSHGLSVAVVNPRRVRAFAVSIGADAKTDAIDASVIRRFAQTTPLELHPVRSEASKRLARLVGRRKQLLKIIHEEENRLAQADDSEIEELPPFGRRR